MIPETRPNESCLIGEELFERVIDGVRQGTHYALVGPPRSGKAFIVEQVKKRLHDRGGPHRPHFAHLHQQGPGDLRVHSLLAAFSNSLSVPAPPGPNSRRCLSDCLVELIHTHVSNTDRRTIIAVQDIHVFPPHQARELLLAFAHCWNDSALRKRIAVIVTGTGDFTAMVQSANSPYRFAQRLSVEGMDRPFAKQYFEWLIGQGLDDAAFNKVFTETNGMTVLLEEIAASQNRWLSRRQQTRATWDQARATRVLDEYFEFFMDESIVLRTMLRDIENRDKEFDTFAEILRSGDGRVTLNPTEEELRTEDDLFPVWGNPPAHVGMEHPPIPFLVVSGAVIRDQRRRAYLSSPILRRFCERRYTTAHLGDVYAGQRRWDAAWAAYAAFNAGDVLRPTAGTSRYRVDDVVLDWGNSFHEAAARGIDAVVDRFLYGARYLLQFRETAIWQLSDRGHQLLPSRASPQLREHVEAMAEFSAMTTSQPADAFLLRRSDDCLLALAILREHGPAMPEIAVALRRTDPDRQIETRTYRVLRRALQSFTSALLACLKEQYALTLGQAAKAHQVALQHAHTLLVNDPVDVNDVLDGVCQSLVDQGYYRVLICLVDPSRTWITGTNEKSVAEAESLKDNTHYRLSDPNLDVQPYVVQANRYHVLYDGATDERANRALCLKAGVVSACILPIRVAELVLGTLHIERGDKKPPSAAECDLFQVFAEQLALIVREGQRMSMLTTALDAFEDPVAFTDAFGRALYLNRSAAAVIGESRGWQLSGPSLSPALDPELRNNEFAHRFDLVCKNQGSLTKYWAPLAGKWATAVSWQGHTIYNHRRDPSALVERFQDLSRTSALTDVIQEAAALSDPRQRARVYLRHLVRLGYGRPRFYLCPDTASPRTLVSFASVGFDSDVEVAEFERGAVRADCTADPVAWLALREHLPIIFVMEPSQSGGEVHVDTDAQGLPVVHLSNQATAQNQFERAPKWIDVPLYSAEEVVGKIAVDYPAHFRPDRWEDLKVFASKIAGGILSAIREKKQVAKIERNLTVARMLSHRMDASLRRCLLACDGLDVLLTPSAPGAAHIRLLRNRTLNSQALIEHLLGVKEHHERTFSAVDVRQVIEEAQWAAQFDVEEWRRADFCLVNWNCTVRSKLPTETVAVRGAAHLLVNALDNLLANAIRAMARREQSGDVHVELRVVESNCVISIGSNGPSFEEPEQYDYVNAICNSTGVLEDLIEIQPSSRLPKDPPVGQHRLGLKVAAWIVKGIHKGALRLSSGMEASPRFEVVLGPLL